jgi:hypothetical protein
MNFDNKNLKVFLLPIISVKRGGDPNKIIFGSPLFIFAVVAALAPKVIASHL